MVVEGAGLISNTIGTVVAEDLDPAHIYEIDGEIVSHHQGTFTLEPGRHAIRVWPQGPAQRMIPDYEAIERERIQVDALELEVEAGYRYYLAAPSKESRTIVEVITEEGAERSLGDWQKTVEPVIVKVYGPLTTRQKVEAMGGFFGSLLLGPLLDDGD